MANGAAASRRCGPWLFFLLNLLYTWIFWTGAIALGGWTVAIGFFLYVIGGTGPLFSALLVTGYCTGTAGLKDLFRRMFDPRRIPAKWLLLSVFLIFAPVLIAVALELAIQGTWTAFNNALAFLSSVPVVLMSFIFNLSAVLFEEPGWRGVALEFLQKQQTAGTSSIIVGLFWAVWHLPLFIMPGTFQESIGLGSLGFWLYMGAVPATSILITWFYNNSSRSILAAMLYHLLNNLAGEMFSLPIPLEVVRFIGVYVVAILVIYYFGYEHLQRKPEERNYHAAKAEPGRAP